LKVLLLTKYGRLGASSRMRFLQYLPWLAKASMQGAVQALISDAQLQRRYRHGGYGLWHLLRAYWARVRAMMQRHRFDLVWIEIEALPWWPLWLERWLLRGAPYVLDYDDAVFHNYDRHPRAWVRHIYGLRLDNLMAGAALVVGGNKYLSQRARDAGAPWVELLPTVIDLQRYPPLTDAAKGKATEGARGSRPRIVWIGSPATVSYLQLLREPLRRLAQHVPFTLRVIGGASIDSPGVDLEFVQWTEETEVVSIQECDIGVMPLLDSPWERGKCGYKLIQYMACGLPVVASPVGVNGEIVRDGVDGFLAGTADEWINALSKLLNNSALRQQMGMSGRRRVESEYCIQKVGPRLVTLLRAAAQGR